MIDTGLRTLLLAQSSITTLVPTQTVNRSTIYPIFCNAPMQGVVPPYVVIKATGGDPMITFDAYSETLKSAEIEVRSYEYTQADAELLDRTIRVFIDDYSGAAGSEDTIAAVSDWTMPVSGYVPSGEGIDSKYFYTETTYSIQYSTP